MKNIVIILIILLILLNSSCGKNRDEEKLGDQKISVYQETSENHYLPELIIKKISNIKIVFEDAQEKKTFQSELEFKPSKNYFRQKLIYQALNKIKKREHITTLIEHQEFDLYNMDLYSVENNIINKILVPNTNDLFDRGSLSFNLNLSFNNLSHIKEIKTIKLKIQAISKKNWNKIELGYLKLKKFGDDNERLRASHSTQVHPRHTYKLSLSDIDQNILRKLLIGEYQIGINIFDLEFKTHSNITLQYKNFIKNFYSQKNYLYIINGKSINRFSKLSKDDLFASLKQYDAGLELSENRQIQYLNNIETYLKKSSSYDQIKEQEIDKGIWKTSYPDDQKSNVIVYVESSLINRLESINNRILLENNNFKQSHLFNITHKNLLISSTGMFHQKLFREERIKQLSKINEPVICERYIRDPDFKGECTHRNLNCSFLRRISIGENETLYKASDFVQSYRFDSKNKIIKQWYSEKLKTHFTIIQLYKDNFKLSLNELNPIKKSPFGVYQFLNCPSTQYSGFRLDGQIFPAKTMIVNKRATLNIKVETISEEY
jgi:hypothetical protein